jgi:hypothetical protein
MGVSAVAGAVVGNVLQSRQAKSVAKGNIREARRAEAAQERDVQRQLKAQERGLKFGRQAVLADVEQQKRDIEAGLEARGMDAAGTIGLGAKRAASADAAKSISDLYANIAQMQSATFQGLDYPMITQAGPQGNWGGDFARLALMSQAGAGGLTKGQVAIGGLGQQVAGQALSNAGLGFFGMPMQMAGQAMTSAATENE